MTFGVNLSVKCAHASSLRCHDQGTRDRCILIDVRSPPLKHRSLWWIKSISRSDSSVQGSGVNETKVKDRSHRN